MRAINRMRGMLRTYNVSTKPVWGPVIELVDLRYRPEENTIEEALAELSPSEHAPLAEPIWTTTPEESGLGVGKTKNWTLHAAWVLGGMALVLAFDVDRCGVVRGHESQSHNSMRHIMAKRITKHSISGRHAGKSRGDARGYSWVRLVGVVFLSQVCQLVMRRQSGTA